MLTPVLVEACGVLERRPNHPHPSALSALTRSKPPRFGVGAQTLVRHCKGSQGSRLPLYLQLRLFSDRLHRASPSTGSKSRSPD